VSDAPISRLLVPDPESLPEEVRDLFDAAHEKLGFVPNVLRAWALRPQHLARWKAHYDLIMRGESRLSVGQREMIAVAVSGSNRCLYCSTTHPAFLRLELQGEGGDPTLAHELSVNPRHASLGPVDRAIVEFALKVAHHSHEIEAEDLERLRDLGLDDEAIFDVAEVAAMFSFTNRLANATGIRPNPEYQGMGR
jgi:uncharacterized peroxidase-related enzyme